jgi:hypothetical protein
LDKKKRFFFSAVTHKLDTQRNALVLTARLLIFLFTIFHPIATVSTSSAEFENYVFSRGGNRLIRTVLIASNGRTFFFIFSTSQNFFCPSLSLSSFLLLPGANNVFNLSSFRSYNENKNNNSWCDESNQKFTLLGLRDVQITRRAPFGLHGDGGRFKNECGIHPISR